MQVCKQLFGNQLQEVVDIRAVHDWHGLVKGCRPQSADEDIQLQFSLQLEVRDGSVIMVRSKPSVSAKVHWGQWYQMMPHPLLGDSVLPSKLKVPVTVTPKPWTQFREKIVPCLRKFYQREYRHPVHIPEDEKQEMLSFLRDGPPPPTAPAWINWTRDDTADIDDPPSPVRSHPVPASCPVVRRKKVWRPFLAPRDNPSGKQCKCGSTAHLRVTHRDCPLNPKRVRSDDGDSETPPRSRSKTNPPASATTASTLVDSESSDDDDDNTSGPDAVVSTETLFRYPVGTKVAVEFSGETYTGTIAQLYPGKDLCQVVFEDGDEAEYDGDEIQYANELYMHKISAKKK